MYNALNVPAEISRLAEVPYTIKEPITSSVPANFGVIISIIILLNLLGVGWIILVNPYLYVFLKDKIGIIYKKGRTFLL